MFDDDHGAVVKIADALSVLAAFFDHGDLNRFAGEDCRSEGKGEFVDVEDADFLDRCDPVQVEIVADKVAADGFGEFDEAGVDFVFFVSGVLVVDSDGNFKFALDAAKDFETPASALASKRIGTVGDVLEFEQDEVGDVEFAVDEAGADEVVDTAVDEDVRVENLDAGAAFRLGAGFPGEDVAHCTEDIDAARSAADDKTKGDKGAFRFALESDLKGKRDDDPGDDADKGADEYGDPVAGSGFFPLIGKPVELAEDKAAHNCSNHEAKEGDGGDVNADWDGGIAQIRRRRGVCRGARLVAGFGLFGLVAWLVSGFIAVFRSRVGGGGFGARCALGAFNLGGRILALGVICFWWVFGDRRWGTLAQRVSFGAIHLSEIVIEGFNDGRKSRDCNPGAEQGEEAYDDGSGCIAHVYSPFKTSIFAPSRRNPEIPSPTVPWAVLMCPGVMLLWGRVESSATHSLPSYTSIHAW